MSSIKCFLTVFLLLATSVAMAQPTQKSVGYHNGPGNGTDFSPAPALDDASQRRMVMSNLSSMPLGFTENQGQFGEEVLFRANVGGATFYFCADEVAYLFTRDTDEIISGDRQARTHGGIGNERPHYKKEALLVKAQLVGANADPEVIGQGLMEYKCNYFLRNDPSKWRTEVPNYSAVVYKNIYPGIDLKYYGDGKSMKYDFIVHPGADLSAIKIRYDGVDALSVTSTGDLQAQTSFGPIHEKVPYIYQEIAGRKHEIRGRYELKEPGVFGFAIDECYNPSFPLIIDPVIVYSTYLGGSGSDTGYGIAVDGYGNAYITGRTDSWNFPTLNAFQPVYGGGRFDAFVTKFNSAGDSLIYSTYLGGNDWDEGHGIDVCSITGQPYITGWTSSRNFPILNAFQPTYGGGDFDAFVTKLGSTGTLVYSSYLGGDRDDYGCAIAVSGIVGYAEAYVTGSTTSLNFPITAGAFQPANAGTADAFVTQVHPAGTSLVYSTYLGGNSGDAGYGIALSGIYPWGNAYVTGSTTSPNFPITAGAFQPVYAGNGDAFATKFNGTGTGLIYSSYLGDSLDEAGYGIALDDNGNAYLTGYTMSRNFPTTPGAFQPVDPGPEEDAFVTKFNGPGSGLTYSTYLGGSMPPYDAYDVGEGIAVENGCAYVTGRTTSTNFPTANAFQPANAGSWDVFVTKFQSGGNALIYSSYLGGTHSDGGMGIAWGRPGNAYVTGYTQSTNFPTVNPFQGVYQGGLYDAFATKIWEAIALSCDCLTSVLCRGKYFYFKLTVTNNTGGNVSGTLTFSGYAGYSCDPANQLIAIPRSKSYSPGTTEEYYYFAVPNSAQPGQYSASVEGNLSGYEVSCCMNVDIIQCSPFKTGDNTEWGLVEVDRPEVEVPLPTVTYLAQNYPNPFNAATNISYSLAEARNVSLKVYDITGRLVETLFEGHQEVGEHEVTWDASQVSSGIYFYKLTCGDYTATKKMSLLK